MIKANKLSVGYGERIVLKKLFFSLPDLRTTSIVGPGGSGKSTLLKVLSGNDGEATLWKKGSFTISSQNLAYLPQKFSSNKKTLRQVLIQENASYLNITWLLNCWKVLPNAPTLLLQNLDKPFDELSLSLQKLLQLAITLSERYHLIMLDEPEVGINAKEQNWLIKQLQSLNGYKTIIIVTHNLAFTHEVADYVIFMLDGEIIESADKETFFNNPKRLRTKQFINWGS
ncbi:MAG: ABC transporter ATP-binding protein [Acidobacteria bacterium]|nr:ABC transporter ATP-binding protein [Acidobacteriota bacterium]